MKPRIICLVVCCSLAGCAKDPVEGTSADGTGTDETSGASTSSATSDDPGTTPGSTSSGTSGPDEPTSTGVTPDTTTTVDPSTTTMDPSTTSISTADPSTTSTSDESSSSADDSTSSGGESSSTGGNACAETVKISIPTTDAQLSGDWAVVMSMVGEGLILQVPNNNDTAGTAVFDVDIPCDDTWTIWARMLNYQNQDSSFVQLDGQPNPGEINAIDCNALFPNLASWNWRKLNRRDPEDECEFLEDPWTADWLTGPHTITFLYRDSESLGRVFVTNDPNYVPTNAD